MIVLPFNLSVCRRNPFTHIHRAIREGKKALCISTLVELDLKGSCVVLTVVETRVHGTGPHIAGLRPA